MTRLIAFLFLATTAVTMLAADRKPVPPAKALEAARRLVVDTFRQELSAPDKVAAVYAMIEAAAKTDGDDAAKVAIYLTAADVAARAGETKLAFEALTRLADCYEADLLALKRTAIESAASHAQTTEAKISVANRCLELAEDAAKANQYDLASEVLKTAMAASAKVGDAELRKAIAEKRRELQQARREADRIGMAITAARKTLDEKPNDPYANEIVGKHLCFDKNDWEKGLKFLAKSGDPNTQKTALADQSSGTDADQMMALGDRWWSLAEAAGDQRDQAGYKSRAVFWYTRAAAGLTGFAKTRVEKRIADAGQAALAAAARQDGGENDKFIDLTLAPGVVMRLMRIPASADGKIKEFYLGQTEVTTGQWKAVMHTLPNVQTSDRLPVCMVSHDDCLDFVQAIDSTSRRYKIRLPTKNEWLHAYACGGDAATVYLENPSQVAWCKENSGLKLHEVATKASNAWGLFDMLGNAQEWTLDRYYCGITYEDSYNRDILTKAIPNPHQNAANTKWMSMGFRVAAERR